MFKKIQFTFHCKLISNFAFDFRLIYEPKNIHFRLILSSNYGIIELTEKNIINEVRKMLSKSHIAANVCSVSLIGCCVYHVVKYYNWVFAEYVTGAGEWVYKFCVNSDFAPAWLFYICAGLLFLLGSILPDIDSSSSLLGRYFHLPVEHRTWTHTVWACALVFAGVFLSKLFFWLGLGYFLHLFWDSLSKGGVCWFYPISHYTTYSSGAKVKKKHILKLYKTGKTSEYVLIGVLITASMLVCAFTIWTHFSQI